MKFAFFVGNALPIYADILEDRPLGGTETGVIRLAEELCKQSHEVSIFTSHESPPPSRRGFGPIFLNLKEVEKHPPVDVFVSIRDWIPLFYKIESKVRCFWTGDSYDQFANYGIGDARVADKIDSFLAVSQWQADQITSRSGFPKEKIHVIKNGIQPELFVQSLPRKRKRMIYSSTPYRGLQHIPRYYPALKEKHPELEIHIFSSYQIYGQSDESAQELFHSLQKLPGCSIYASCTQKRLASEFLQSSILFYPCCFEETSCITAMEAMRAGAVVLSSWLGALPETCGKAGVLVKGQPGDSHYDNEFLLACDRLLSDDVFFEKQQALSIQQARDLTWEKVAERFLNLF